MASDEGLLTGPGEIGLFTISSPSTLVSGSRGLAPTAAAVVQANLELLVVAVGILGLIHDSRASSASDAWVNLHVLFGALLWLSVIARFHRRRIELPGISSVKIHAFARRLSRRIYLLLYGLMFLNLGLGVIHSTSPREPFESAEFFRPYLACGVFALVTIQCLAALCLRRGGGGNG